jgi:hypothetical protein
MNFIEYKKILRVGISSYERFNQIAKLPDLG